MLEAWPPPAPAEIVTEAEGMAGRDHLSIDGAVFVKLQAARGNETLLPQIAVADTVTAEAAGIVNLRGDQTVVRGRFTMLAPLSPDDEAAEFDAQLLEAAWDGAISQRFDVRIGKTFLGWDPGFATQPNGFFQGDPDFADLTDFENRLEGVWLASLTWVGDSADVTVALGEVADDPRLSDRPDIQFVVRGAADIGPATVALILRTTDTGRTGLGLTGSATLSRSVTAQLSSFYDETAWRAAIGGTYLHRSGLSVSLELSHDELNPDTVPFIAVTAPRTFADVRLGRTTQSGDWSLGVRKSLEDDSALVTGAYSYQVNRHATLRFEAGAFVGGTDAHYGRAPVREFVGVSLFAAID